MYALNISNNTARQHDTTVHNIKLHIRKAQKYTITIMRYGDLTDTNGNTRYVYCVLSINNDILLYVLIYIIYVVMRSEENGDLISHARNAVGGMSVETV